MGLGSLRSTIELFPRLRSTTCREFWWSGRRDLNPRLQPWQGCTLPLSYSRMVCKRRSVKITFWRRHPDLNWRWRFCRPLPYHLAMPPAKNLERETGFEPATSTLARLHSTTELLPLSRMAFYCVPANLSSGPGTLIAAGRQKLFCFTLGGG